jgi:peptide/nickel transport system permease protein
MALERHWPQDPRGVRGRSSASPRPDQLTEWTAAPTIAPAAAGEIGAGAGSSAARATARSRLRGRWRRRLLRNPLSTVGGAVVLFLVLCAVAPAALAPIPGDAGPSVHFDRTFQPPGPGHWFGTDEVGRDILSRSIFAARTSLTLTVVVLGIALGAGIPLGLVAGYWNEGRASAVIMRVTDIFLSVPPLALALAAAAAFRPDLGSAAVAISFAWWPWYARLVYGEVLARREEPFVEAARALGQRELGIAFRRILPHVVSPIVVKATLDVSFVILLGSGLSFLGVGAQEPTPDWGAMIARGRAFLPAQWWVSTMPGAVIFVAVMGFNLLGDALRDAFDVWE